MRGRDVVLALLAACAPSVAHGQILRGLVIDVQTGAPLASTEIRLITDADSVVERTLADEEGRFRIKAPYAGAWRVGVDRLGYTSPVLGPIELGSGQVQDVEIRLSVAAVVLDALSVTAEPRIAALETVGFYDRRRAGFGRFMDRLEMEEIPAVRTSDLFRRMTGARVVYGPRGQEFVVLRGGLGSSFGNALCLPRVFLDGVQVSMLDWREIPPGTLDGIEVFRSTAEVPAQYGGTDATCGVILAWTRRGD